MIPYTVCFCTRKDLVLMLCRRRPPNAGLWNGLGGKILPGETPLGCVRREVLEEAGMDLGSSRGLRFAGVVRWSAGVDPTSCSTGMHAFVAELPDNWPVREDEREVAEGMLSRKPVRWVCDPDNGEVVSNIPRFLPNMLGGTEPMEYRCRYAGDKLLDIAVSPL